MFVRVSPPHQKQINFVITNHVIITWLLIPEGGQVLPEPDKEEKKKDESSDSEIEDGGKKWVFTCYCYEGRVDKVEFERGWYAVSIGNQNSNEGWDFSE